jgi:hypothetical protein
MADPCISLCTIKVYLLDLLGVIPAIDPLNPPKFYVGSGDQFFHGATLVLPFSKSVSFNNLGAAEIDIMETETPGQSLQMFITMPESYSTRVIQFVPAIIPNDTECPLSKITVAKQFGFS